MDRTAIDAALGPAGLGDETRTAAITFVCDELAGKLEVIPAGDGKKCAFRIEKTPDGHVARFVSPGGFEARGLSVPASPWITDCYFTVATEGDDAHPVPVLEVHFAGKRPAAPPTHAWVFPAQFVRGRTNFADITGEGPLCAAAARVEAHLINMHPEMSRVPVACDPVQGDLDLSHAASCVPVAFVAAMCANIPEIVRVRFVPPPRAPGAPPRIFVTVSARARAAEPPAAARPRDRDRDRDRSPPPAPRA